MGWQNVWKNYRAIRELQQRFATPFLVPGPPNKEPGLSGFTTFEDLREAGEDVQELRAAHPVPSSSVLPVSSYPPTYVARLAGASIRRSYGRVVTADHRLLMHTGPSLDLFRCATPHVATEGQAPQLETSNEALAVIATDYANENYFHFMYDSLPRLQVLRESDCSYDRLLVNAVRHAFQREAFAALGVASDSCVSIDYRTAVQPKEVISASLPSLDMSPPPWTCEFLRKTFLPTPCDKPFRRLYISRGDTHYRRLFNEDSLFHVLEQMGFAFCTLRGLTIREQARLFSEAAIIVAPHGAGLANICFCQPGTSLVEIRSPRYHDCCYERLAEVMQMRYFCTRGFKGGFGSVEELWDRIARPPGLMRHYSAPVSNVRLLVERVLSM